MTFKDLKEGDNIFVVNEGEDFGIRIEKHEIIKFTQDSLTIELTLDDSSLLFIDKSLAEKERCSFYFTNLKDAMVYFLEREVETYSSFVRKAAKYLKKYNDCVEIMDSISNERDRVETELVLNGYNLEN
jgi:hypothetical protein